MLRTRTALLLVAVLAAVLGATSPGLSSASFTSRSTSTGTISAAADWTPPTVSIADPGKPVKDTVTLTATAADAETGIASVALEYLAPGAGSWTTICTRAAAPYTCSWNTKIGPDGGYDLRATATDNAGYATISSTVSTTVANNTLVVLADPGDNVRGSTSLVTSIFNGGSLSYSVKVEYAVAGSTTWKTACSSSTSPYSCSWNTASLANTLYDLRATATSGGTSYTSAPVTDVQVDNAAPTVSMTDPGTPLRGTVTIAGTANDADSGVAQVVLQYQVVGNPTWKNFCTVADAPYSCRFDTTAIADGTYGVRAVATDNAGNTATSTVIANRLVDNTVSAVSVEDPGAFLRSTVTVRATASSTAGVTSVRVQYAASGTTGWTDICTDNSAPYSCAWTTTQVVDGLYDVRAILVDGRGGVTTSASIAARRVDNINLRAADVQATNGGAAGKVDNGDKLTFVYSEQVSPATVTPGWDGTSLAVQVRLRDGNLLGLGNNGDTIDVLRTNSTVNLGQVTLNGGFIRSSKTTTFNATMVLGTRVVGGVTQSTVTLTIGSAASGANSIQAGPPTSTMVWTPLASVTDLTGNPCSTTPVTETGTADKDF